MSADAFLSHPEKQIYPSSKIRRGGEEGREGKGRGEGRGEEGRGAEGGGDGMGRRGGNDEILILSE